MIQTTFPLALVASMPDFLDLSLQHLDAWHKTFSELCLTSSVDLGASEDGETTTLPQLATTILDLLTNVLRGGRAKSWFADGGHVMMMVQTAFYWSQMTQDDVSNVSFQIP